MTLMKAIAIVGGLTEWASDKGVQIMSEGSTGQEATVQPERHPRDAHSGPASQGRRRDLRQATIPVSSGERQR